MLLRITNNDKIRFDFKFTLEPEDFGIWWQYMEVPDQLANDLYGVIQSQNYNLHISIVEDDGTEVLSPVLLSELIDKYGFSSGDDFPITGFAKRYQTSIVVELMALFLYDKYKFVYYVKNRHIYRIDNGVEIPMYSNEWHKIRDLNDVDFCKTVFIGYSLQYYFERLGYALHRGNVEFMYSSYKEFGL